MSAPHYTPPPPPDPEPAHQPSLENLLLRFGLVTLDQLGAAMREQTETGTPFQDVLVRDGVVRAEDLARVLDRTPAAEPAPAPAPEPEHAPEPEQVPASDEKSQAEEDAAVEPLPVPPVAFAPAPEPVTQPLPAVEPEPVALAPEPVALAPEPAPVPEPTPAPVLAGYVVRGRLVNGEEIEISTVTDPAEAQRIARDAMRACARTNGADWPILNGRYVRPEAIVSIEVAESYA